MTLRYPKYGKGRHDLPSVARVTHRWLAGLSFHFQINTRLGAKPQTVVCHGKAKQRHIRIDLEMESDLRFLPTLQASTVIEALKAMLDRAKKV